MFKWNTSAVFGEDVDVSNLEVREYFFLRLTPHTVTFSLYSKKLKVLREGLIVFRDINCLILLISKEVKWIFNPLNIKI